MATSILISPPVIDGRELTSSTTTFIPRSSFLASTKHFHSAPCISSIRRRNSRSMVTAAFPSMDDIPKRFRGENLPDGLMDNYKNIPPSLYGLTPSQMEMFMPEDRTIEQNPDEIDEETLTSAHYFAKKAKLSMLDSYGGRRARSRIDASRKTHFRGGKRDGKRRFPPPDLPSYLLYNQIIYLGLPLYPPVTELIVAQFLWLDYYKGDKPIYLYINSTGTQDEYGRLVGAETDAYAIADCMSQISATIHTVNCGTAYGQAAMLLSLGDKGRRNLLPGCTTKLYLPQMEPMVGETTDMYIEAKELEARTDIFLELLERGIGKPRDEINKDLQHGKFLMPLEAIKYGVADRMLKVAPGKEYDMPKDLREYLKEEEEKKSLSNKFQSLSKKYLSTEEVS